MLANFKTAAICFGQFGPYHHARVVALQRAAAEQGVRVIPVQIASATSTYEWTEGGESRVASKRCDDLRTLCEGVEEAASPLEVFLKARKLFREETVDVAFLPSYSPARFFALFAAAKSLGIRTVMMNESHAGTEQATGWKRWIKRQIVKRFDAALVGGEPHKRHFASLGISDDKIFTGYDAVDNDFFASRADEIRAAAKKSGSASALAVANGSGVTSSGQVPSTRKAYGLPERYFLSLGRMVEKKNLATLIAAYARYAEGVAVAGKRLKIKGDDGEKQGDMPGGAASPPQAKDSEVVTSHQSLATRYSLPALVFVGSGELEGALRERARSLGLRVVERTDWRVEKTGYSRATRDGARRSREQIDPEPWKDFSHGSTRINTDGSERLAADRTEENAADPVIAYGPSTASGPPVRAGCGLSPETTDGEDAAATKTRDSLPATSHEENCGTVFFYGFRQIEENPVFYALAEAFVLPSLKEEWGLVVNEAMAAGLPVIVSRTAGCAEDLVPKATASRSSQLAVGSIQSGENVDADDSLEERSNGFVFDPKSSDALSEALRRIADQKTKRRQDQETDGLTEMGRRSREIVERFSCENFAQQALRAAEATSA